jgi:hypothetical protein
MLSRLKAAGPWLAVCLFLLLPIYVISAVVVIRSNIFDLDDGAIGGEEFKALWTFIASGLATAATVIGLLFTKSHNDRTLAFQKESEKEGFKRFQLDTVVKGLELVGSGKDYSPKAKIAGGLAAMIHLDQPVVAMRTLSAAWTDKAVDTRTACWLISEVLETGSDASKEEAADLLLRHASDLVSNDLNGVYDWPPAIDREWPLQLPINAKGTILLALISILVSRDRAWWVSASGRHYNWVIATLGEVLSQDNDPATKGTAAYLLRELFDLEDGEGYSVVTRSGWKAAADIEKQAFEYEVTDVFGYLDEAIQRIRAWGMGEAAASTVQESTNLSPPSETEKQR